MYHSLYDSRISYIISKAEVGCDFARFDHDHSSKPNACVVMVFCKNLFSFLLPQAEQELRMTQSEFDRQAEITRLLLEGVSSTHVRSPAQLLLQSAFNQ